MVDVAGVRLTHPDRVLYPDCGITKLDLATYYASVSDWILPHIAGRPMSIVRCPEGQGAPCFYQKHVLPGMPKSIRRIAIPGGTGTIKEGGEYLYVDDVPGLVTLVQFGALELHPWGTKVGALERPDRMTIDLDPGPGVDWDRTVESALALQARLEDLGLASFVKTTGGKGLHVVTPLLPRHSWDEVKDFSRSIAEEFVRAAPDRFVATMTKSKRQGKIFLDFFRNTRGATSVAAYSTRSRAGAPVSAPLTWAELSRLKSPDAFTVISMPTRLRRRATDPWAGFFEVRQTITGAMKRAVRQPPMVG